jgi:hypothetical protein
MGQNTSTAMTEALVSVPDMIEWRNAQKKVSHAAIMIILETNLSHVNELIYSITMKAAKYGLLSV